MRGFRNGSENYVGEEAIAKAESTFSAEGFWLADDSTLRAKVLDGLRGVEMTTVLQSYAVRAQRGSEDAALLAGTGKDLMEATAAHVLTSIRGDYPLGANFVALLGIAFMALDLAVPEQPVEPGEAARKALERGLFASACGANKLQSRRIADGRNGRGCSQQTDPRNFGDALAFRAVPERMREATLSTAISSLTACMRAHCSRKLSTNILGRRSDVLAKAGAISIANDC